MRKFKRKKCPGCGRMFANADAWCRHVQLKHSSLIPEGFTPKRYLYFLQTGMMQGRCSVCGAPSEWNEGTGKYLRTCKSPACKQKYSIRHGTASDKQQMDMIMHRKISGYYNYDGIEIPYTGSYEKNFLEHLHLLSWDANDIQKPIDSVVTYDYTNENDPENEGGKRRYTPDYFIPSLNLYVEIKTQTNTHPNIIAIDKVKEREKDEAMASFIKHHPNYHYIKINDNRFDEFDRLVSDLSCLISDEELKEGQRQSTSDSVRRASLEAGGALESVFQFEPEDMIRERECLDDLFEITNDTGIVIIHYCDEEDELDELYEAWIDMTPSQRRDSDNICRDYFGMSNLEHYFYLRKMLTDLSMKNYKNPYDDDDADNDNLDRVNVGTSAKESFSVVPEKKAPTDVRSWFELAKTTIENNTSPNVPTDGMESHMRIALDQIKRVIPSADLATISIDVVKNDSEETKQISFPFINFQLPGCESYISTLTYGSDGMRFVIGKSYQSVQNGLASFLANFVTEKTDKWTPAATYDLGTESGTTLSGISYTDKADVLYEVHSADDVVAADLKFSIMTPEEEFEIATEGFDFTAMKASLAQAWAPKLFTGASDEFYSGNFMGKVRDHSVVTVANGMITISNIAVYALFSRMKRFYDNKNIKNIFIVHYNEKSWKKYQKKKISRSQLRIDSISSPIFFALELIEMFNELSLKYRDFTYASIARKIYKQTWVAECDAKFAATATNSTSRLSNLDLELLPYQQTFVEEYPRLKAVLNLKGYMLAFEQGLGKTLTAIALAECGAYNRVYIVCPNSLVENWALEIRKYYKKYHDDDDLWQKEVVMCKNQGSVNVNEKLPGRFFIVNNESIPKMYPYAIPGKNMLIVDESHNFRNMNAKRTQELISLQTKISAEDTLLLSGTPIKAIPNEIAPALALIDPLFTEEVSTLYVKAFNINNTSALNMINKRFGHIMYRKDKSELPNLPAKNIDSLSYPVANSEEYLFSTIRNNVFDRFTTLFQQKLLDNKALMTEMITMVKRYSSASLETTTMYCKWLTTVNTSKMMRLHDSELDVIGDFLVLYVYPNIQSQLVTKRMKELEAKFIHMKQSALSTAMGEFLPPARNEAFIHLFNENMEEIIDMIVDNDMKTVIFSQFVDVVNFIESSLNEAGIKTVKITGAVTNDRMEKIRAFQEDDNVRVLVATSSTVGTGFTLVQANQVFFFGTPWRDADFQQCCDRVHRIGQVSDVNIYVVTIDTGSNLNVTTRMSQVLRWSKDMFDAAIVNTTEEELLSDMMESMDSN